MQVLKPIGRKDNNLMIVYKYSIFDKITTFVKTKRYNIKRMTQAKVKTQREPISSLYVLKALCAIGVVSLHAPFGIGTEYIRLISSVTVPIFFMITGYFLYTEDRDIFLKRAWKTIKKVALLIVILNLMFVPLAPIEGAFFEEYMLYFKWIVLGQTNGFGHLWYLTALLEAIVSMSIVVYVCKKRGISLLKYFSLFWILQLLNGPYRELIFGLPESMMNANFVTYALPCISFGFIVKEYENRFLQKNNWLFLMLFSIVLVYLNRFILQDIAYNLSVIFKPWLRLTMIFTIFLWALSKKAFGSGSCFVYMGDKLSGSIYYFHGLFVFVWIEWFERAYDYSTWGFLYVLFPSIFLAYIIAKIQDSLKVHIF